MYSFFKTSVKSHIRMLPSELQKIISFASDAKWMQNMLSDDNNLIKVALLVAFAVISRKDHFINLKYFDYLFLELFVSFPIAQNDECSDVLMKNKKI